MIQLETLKTRLIDKVAPHNPGAPGIAGNATGRFQKEVASSPSELANTLASLGPAGLKPYIVANNRFLWPFWCELIPDYLFCWQELTEVPIQSDGTFNAEICFWCPEDFPDLYFEVVQNLDGVETEIYDPQIACSTFYDYDGTESVDIVIDDPRAVACQPTQNPGPDYLYVWPTANRQCRSGERQRTRNGGRSGTRRGDGDRAGRQSGKCRVGRHLVIADAVPSRPAGQQHQVLPLVVPVRRRGEPDADQGNGHPPLPDHHGFRLDHHDPSEPGDVRAAAGVRPVQSRGTTNLFAIPDPTLPWIDINDPLDRPFAYFDSTELLTPGKSGLCTLILELFDGDGKFVPCNNPRSSSTIGDQPSDPAGPGAFTYILPQIGGPPNTYTNAPMFNITDHGV